MGLLTDMYRGSGSRISILEQREIDYNNVYVTMGDDKLLPKDDKYGELDAITDVENAFEEQGHDIPRRIGTKNASIDSIIESIRGNKPSVVINLCEFIRELNIKKSNMCNLFDMFKIPYTGNDSFALSVATDKFTAKYVMKGVGILTPEFKEFRPGDKVSSAGMRFPLFVKPVDEDSSVGIDSKSLVRDEDELVKRVKYVFDEIEDAALVEEYIDGREINCAVLGNDDPYPLYPCEVDMSKLPKNLPKINSYNAKFKKGTKENSSMGHNCPADLPEEISKEIQRQAVEAFKVFRCRDYARCDFRLDADGSIYMIEMNANPDIANIANLGIARKAYGISMWEFLEFIMSEAVKRMSLSKWGI